MGGRKKNDSPKAPEAEEESGDEDSSLREEKERLERLDRAWEARNGPRKGRRGRGRQRQNPRRETEASARAEAVRFSHRVKHHGGEKQDAARRLRIPERTLRHWDHQRSLQRRKILRGRPLVRSSREDRSGVIATLEEFGPQLGLEVLKALNAGMPRGELQDLLWRYRRVYRRVYVATRGDLHWPSPGTVWAMDHVWLPEPIDGALRQALALRDLSSGFQLLWHPVRTTSAADTVGLLEEVFYRVGRPLVLKSDRGSAFISGLMQELLERHEVEHLLSPSYWPQYNGGVEAGNRCLKERSDHQAVRAGHPGRWSPEDMERARRISNLLPRTRRSGRIPEEVWARRTPLTPRLRGEFRQTVEAQIPGVLEELGVSSLDGTGTTDRLDINRIAISRALVAHGFLQHRRRRISLPLKSKKAAKIS